MTRAEIVARMVERREALGLTQEDLAGQLGVARGSVSNMETARCNVSTDLLIRACEILRLEVRLEELTLSAEELRAAEQAKIARAESRRELLARAGRKRGGGEHGTAG